MRSLFISRSRSFLSRPFRRSFSPFTLSASSDSASNSFIFFLRPAILPFSSSLQTSNASSCTPRRSPSLSLLFCSSRLRVLFALFDPYILRKSLPALSVKKCVSSSSFNLSISDILTGLSPAMLSSDFNSSSISARFLLYCSRLVSSRYKDIPPSPAAGPFPMMPCLAPISMRMKFISEFFSKGCRLHLRSSTTPPPAPPPP